MVFSHPWDASLRVLSIAALLASLASPLLADEQTVAAPLRMHKTGLKVPTNWRHGANFVQQNPYSLDADLPSSYDWRTQAGGLSPVENQGNCGGCWAFATTATLADAIMIKDQQSRSLSQQYLVSCDNHGWNCSGGWFASDMYQEFGSVYSADLPYSASNAACPAKLTHHEKIENWAYAGSPAGGVPAANDIKRAIMEFGPVAVAVNATYSFQFYRSGVFTNCSKSGADEVNHAVNLVGWNDEGGYWIMRNSWGSSWGEKGYMRIKYGCNNIGYAANYQNYKPACSPQPVASAGKDAKINNGESVRIGSSAMQGESFEWAPADGLDDPSSATPTATPKSTTLYTVTVKNACGIAASQVQITVGGAQQ